MPEGRGAELRDRENEAVCECNVRERWERRNSERVGGRVGQTGEGQRGKRIA